MSEKKRYCLIYIIIILLLVNSVNGDNHFGGGTGEKPEIGEEVTDALSQGTDFSGSVPANTQVTLPDGTSATVSGNVQVSGGAISADSITVDGKTYTNVVGFKKQGGKVTFTNVAQSNPTENVEVSNAEQGEEDSDGSHTYQATSTYKTPELFATNGRGISYNAPTQTLTIEHADSVIINNKDIIIDVNNFEVNPQLFKLKDADSVMFICIDTSERLTMTNVTDSTFRTNGIVEIIADENINYDIADCGENNVRLIADKGKKITITKVTEPVYTMDKGVTLEIASHNLEINASEDGATAKLTNLIDGTLELTTVETFTRFDIATTTETLLAKGETTIKIDPNEGIYYANLGSPARLSFKDKVNANKSFVVFRPADLDESFALVINKPSHRVLFSEFESLYKESAGFIDLDNHFMHFIGIIDYSRFDEFQRIKKILESKHKNNEINIDLDNDNIKIKKLDIQGKGFTCNREEIFASTHNHNYNIIEICNPTTGFIERYIGFENIHTPDIIQEYSSWFDKKHPNVLFNNKMAAFNNQKTKVNFFSNDISSAFYLNEINTYQQYFTNCIEYNQHYFQNQIENTIFKNEI